MTEATPIETIVIEPEEVTVPASNPSFLKKALTAVKARRKTVIAVGLGAALIGGAAVLSAKSEKVQDQYPDFSDEETIELDREAIANYTPESN